MNNEYFRMSLFFFFDTSKAESVAQQKGNGAVIWMWNINEIGLKLNKEVC